MDLDKPFYTMTMARLYDRQGKPERAARIYRYLLDRSPDRADVRQALEALSARLPRVPEKWPEVSGRVEQWVRLMLRHDALQRLQRKRLRRLK